MDLRSQRLSRTSIQNLFKYPPSYHSAWDSAEFLSNDIGAVGARAPTGLARDQLQQRYLNVGVPGIPDVLKIE